MVKPNYNVEIFVSSEKKRTTNLIRGVSSNYINKK